MADTQLNEVYRQLRTSQEKYTHLLLALAASAIAFAVSRTDGRQLCWSLLPLGGAVIAWGWSFFAGCQNLRYVNSTLWGNCNLLLLEGGHNVAGVPMDPHLRTAVADGVRHALEANSDKANRLGHAQFYALVTGGLLYLVWHVTEMVLRTVSVTPSPPLQ